MILTSLPDASEFAADALALRHVVETLAKLRLRIDEAERRANDRVDRVARKHFGDLTGALKRALQ